MLPTTPLEPFHSNTERVTYNSDAVRHHFHLGYTYPELQHWKYDNDEKKYIESIRKAVQELYGDHQEDAAALQAVATYGDYIVNIKFERYIILIKIVSTISFFLIIINQICTEGNSLHGGHLFERTRRRQCL